MNAAWWKLRAGSHCALLSIQLANFSTLLYNYFLTTLWYFVKYDGQSRQRPLQSFWATVDLTKRFNLCILWTFLIIFITTWNWYLVFTSLKSKIYFWHGKLLQCSIMYSIVPDCLSWIIDVIVYKKSKLAANFAARLSMWHASKRSVQPQDVCLLVYVPTNPPDQWFLEYWRSCSLN